MSRAPLPWQIGDLVTCVVRRSTSRGCVLGIQGTNETGLLHISCMSKAFVRDPTVRQELLVWDFGLGSFNCHFIINATNPTLYQVVFENGEVIHAIVVGYDPGPSNLAFSTAELEEEAGDILHNRQKCWDSKRMWQGWRDWERVWGSWLGLSVSFQKALGTSSGSLSCGSNSTITSPYQRSHRCRKNAGALHGAGRNGGC